MLRSIGILTQKELKIYFLSPLAYLLAACFIFLLGWFFFNSIVFSQEAQSYTLTESVIRPIFGNMNFIFLIMAPLLTMSPFAEEKKQQTLPLLLMSFLSPLQIILAKLCAVVLVAIFMMALTFIFPLIMSFSGHSDWAYIITGYIGTILNVCSYLSLGLFISSLTENQIVAALSSFGALLGLLLLSNAPFLVDNYLLAQLLRYLSMAYHFEPFTRGVMKISDCFYFVSFIGFFIYLTNESLKAQRW